MKQLCKINGSNGADTKMSGCFLKVIMAELGIFITVF